MSASILAIEFTHSYSGTGKEQAILTLLCDTETDMNNFVSARYEPVQGSKAHIISNQLDYEMLSDGTWVQKQGQDLVSIINTLSNLDAEVSALGDDVNDLYGVVGNIKDAVKVLTDDYKNRIVLLPSMSTSFGSLNLTVNDNGTVTLNGTNDTGSSAFFSVPITFPAGAYVFNGMQEAGGTSTYRQELRATPGGSVYQVNDTELPTTFERTTSYSGYYSIRIANGFVANNVVIKPMIALEQLLAVAPDFKAGAPTNRELYQLIRGYHP